MDTQALAITDRFVKRVEDADFSDTAESEDIWLEWLARAIVTVKCDLGNGEFLLAEFSWDHRVCEPVYDTLQIWTYTSDGLNLEFCDIYNWSQHLGILSEFGFESFAGHDYLKCDFLVAHYRCLSSKKDNTHGLGISFQWDGTEDVRSIRVLSTSR